MKCFERQVKDFFTSVLPLSFDPLQFANHPNGSIEDAIATVLHLSLEHLENRNALVQMLFSQCFWPVFCEAAA